MQQSEARWGESPWRRGRRWYGRGARRRSLTVQHSQRKASTGSGSGVEYRRCRLWQMQRLREVMRSGVDPAVIRGSRILRRGGGEREGQPQPGSPRLAHSQPQPPSTPAEAETDRLHIRRARAQGSRGKAQSQRPRQRLRQLRWPTGETLLFAERISWASGRPHDHSASILAPQACWCRRSSYDLTLSSHRSSAHLTPL